MSLECCYRFCGSPLVPALAGAQGRRIPKRDGHINDFAAVLEGPAKQRLKGTRECAGKDRRRFCLITVKTSGNEDLYDYSVRVSSSWDVGPATRRIVCYWFGCRDCQFSDARSRTARARSRAYHQQPAEPARAAGHRPRAALIAAVRTRRSIGSERQFQFCVVGSASGETLAPRANDREQFKVRPPSQRESQPTPAAVPRRAKLRRPRRKRFRHRDRQKLLCRLNLRRYLQSRLRRVRRQARPLHR